MYLAPDDAKTDVILVGAVAVFGGAARAFVTSLGFLPRQGLGAAVVTLLWIVALTAVVPLLLARYRGDGAAAMALDRSGRRPTAGLALALPLVALGMGIELVQGDDPLRAVLGRFAGPLMRAGGPAPVELLVVAAQVAALAVGALVLVAFVSVRAREGFPRSPDVPLTQLVRTVGLVAVAGGAVLGLLRALAAGSLLVGGLALLHVAALAALLWLTDRRVTDGLVVVRAAVVAPVVVVLVAHVFATGGLFFGDLLTGLYTGALALGVTVAIAALAQTRAGAWPAVAAVVAAHWWPTCTSPLAIAPGVC